MQYKYTQDWVTGKIPIFTKVVGHLQGLPNLRFLEIGCFEGRSTIWWLQNILTHETSSVVCIDPFTGIEEDAALNPPDLFNTFLYNIQEFKHKIQVQKGPSATELCRPEVRNKQYDFVFIDGCHRAKEVLEDAVLTFDLVRSGGIMLFDDYEWGDFNQTPRRTPKLAIDSFFNCYKLHLNLLYKSSILLYKSSIFGEMRTSLLAVKKK